VWWNLGTSFTSLCGIIRGYMLVNFMRISGSLSLNRSMLLQSGMWNVIACRGAGGMAPHHSVWRGAVMVEGWLRCSVRGSKDEESSAKTRI
jgi:hypothetical protein